MQYYRAAAALAVLVCTAQAAAAAWDPTSSEQGKTLAEMCPGNLIVNGDFELPDTTKTPTELRDTYSNSKWGWYKRIPGNYSKQCMSITVCEGLFVLH